MASIGLPIFRSTAGSSFGTEQNLNIKVNESMSTLTFGCRRNYEVIKKSSGRLKLRASESEITPKSIIRQLADRHPPRTIVEGGGGFRQVFVVRPCDVGIDKNVTIESILNFFQDTEINHLKMSGFSSDESAVTPGMLKHNLIWTVVNLIVEINDYPGWDDVLEVDTWIRPAGSLQIGVFKFWTIRNLVNGKFHARARSFCTMLNEKTRQTSRIPDDVRDEISQILSKKKEVELKLSTKIEELVDAKYITSFKPEKKDIGINKYVKNVKYANWIVEAIPEQILRDYQLSTITLAYKRGCRISDTIQSLCEPDKDNGILEKYKSIDNLFGFTHLLQIEGDERFEEIIRGRTTWKHRNI